MITSYPRNLGFLVTLSPLASCGAKRGVLPDDFAQVSAFLNDDRIRQELAYLIVRRARVLRVTEDLSSGDWPVDTDKSKGRCTAPSPQKVSVESAFDPPTETSSVNHGPLVLTNTQQVQARWALQWDTSKAAPGIQVECLDAHTIKAPKGGWNGLVSFLKLEATMSQSTQTVNKDTHYGVQGTEFQNSLWEARCSWKSGSKPNGLAMRSLECSESGHFNQKTSGDWVSSRDVNIHYTSTTNTHYELWWNAGTQQLNGSMKGGLLSATSPRYGISLEISVNQLEFSALHMTCQPSQGSLEVTVIDNQTKKQRQVEVKVLSTGKYTIAFQNQEPTPFEELADADLVHCFSL